jgi:non-ribosomal peptide synthetase component F
MAHLLEGTDARSGYRSSDGVYYSKRPTVWIPPTRRLDLLSFLFAPQYGERAALVDAPTGQSFTYAQLEWRVRVVAAGLYKTLGVRQYDVVMLLSPNCVEFAVIFLAVVSLGAVLTTVNQVNTALEIQKQMKDAGRAPHIPLPPSLSLPCLALPSPPLFLLHSAWPTSSRCAVKSTPLL